MPPFLLFDKLLVPTGPFAKVLGTFDGPKWGMPSLKHISEQKCGGMWYMRACLKDAITRGVMEELIWHHQVGKTKQAGTQHVTFLSVCSPNSATHPSTSLPKHHTFTARPSNSGSGNGATNGGGSGA